MGIFADFRARLMRSLRTQTPAGSQWLGEQLRRLFPPSLPESQVGNSRLEVLISLDGWALDLAPEKHLGRLRPMVETWARQAPEREVAIAAREIGDDLWLLEAVEQVRKRDPANGWLGVGLMMLQGAFKQAGLITQARCYDEFKFEVITNWI